MLPISLTFQAFGAYKGKQTIDFTKFLNNKLFLITGKTGSGKTMIFDAICYALFGETSGQEREVETIKSQFSDNSVLSFVEFEFLHKNKKYIITREPKQIKLSRGKEILHKPTAKIIFDDKVESGIKNVDKIIMEILGIDYTQFKQIVMIAQGEFRKLVSSDSKEREAIYRKIFDTTKFENIQNILKERYLDVDKRVSILNEKIKTNLESIKSIIEISYEDTTIEQILKILDEQILNFTEKIEILSNQKQVLKDKFEKSNELFLKFKDRETFKQKLSEFDIPSLKQEKVFLENADKVLKIIIPKEEVLNKLKSKYQTLSDEKLNFENLKIVHIQALEKLKPQVIPKRDYENKLHEFENRLKDIKNLEIIIDEKLRYETQILNDNEKLSKLNLKKLKIQTQVQDLNNKRKEIVEYTLQHQDINEKILNLKNLIGDLHTSQKYFQNYITSLKSLKVVEQNHKEILPKFETLFNKYQEMRTNLLNIKDIYLKNQAGILAQNLKEGTPCIVCGSLNHPNKAKLNNELIDELTIKKLEEEFNQVEQDKNLMSEEIISLKNELEIKKDNVTEKYNDLYSLKISKNIFKFELFDLGENFENNIKNKIDIYKNQERNLNIIQQKITVLRKELNEIGEMIKVCMDEENRINTQISDIEGNIKVNTYILNEKVSLLDEHEIYNKEDYTTIFNRIEIDFNNFVKINEKLNEEVKILEDEIKKCETQIDIRNSDMNESTKDITFHEEELNNMIKRDFQDIEEYNKFKISNDEFDKRDKFLSAKRDEYNHLKKSIENLNKDLENLNKKTINEFENEINNLKLQIEQVDAQDKKIFMESSLIKKARESIYRDSGEISNLYEYKINLNELNKISNGNNNFKISFERYILGIYFKEIIEAANVRFLKLTNGRFLFKHLKENIDLRIKQGLDISVFDNNTLSERRVNTLSGGESFKASLSLALGLSDVIQNYSGGILIDTLFIDEGFGTLDYESLQNALDCLSDINDKSRIIGIISHVQELKDFIKSRIEVIDSPNGSKINIVS